MVDTVSDELDPQRLRAAQGLDSADLQVQRGLLHPVSCRTDVLVCSRYPGTNLMNFFAAGRSPRPQNLEFPCKLPCNSQVAHLYLAVYQ